MGPNDHRAFIDAMSGHSDMQPDPREISYIWQQPTHVVVDTIDGYTYKGDATGVLFDGPRAVQFANTRNNEQNPGFKSFIVFRLEQEASFEPVFDNITPQWSCRACGQEWPVRSSAQAISQNAKASAMHPGEDCQPGDEGFTPTPAGELVAWQPAPELNPLACDVFECHGMHEENYHEQVTPEE
jgi:hypothetical protein